MIGSSLHRYKTNARYMAQDFEGEGLNIAIARPYQVAYAIADNKGIHSTKMDYIWWPDLRMTKESIEITNFDWETYKANARPAAEVLAEYEAELYRTDTETVWQNGLRYDAYAHNNWRRACGLKPDWSYLLRSIDVDVLTKSLKKQWTPDISSLEAWFAYQYKVSGYIEKGLKTNLELCGREEKIDHDYSTLHDALSDITLMTKIFWKRLYQVEF